MSDDEVLGPGSVLKAIEMGLWDFEPDEVSESRFTSTNALPGSKSKLEILAERAREGLPLWHSYDCCDYDDHDVESAAGGNQSRS